jgi:alpha-glucosidase
LLLTKLKPRISIQIVTQLKSSTSQIYQGFQRTYYNFNRTLVNHIMKQEIFVTKSKISSCIVIAFLIAINSLQVSAISTNEDLPSPDKQIKITIEIQNGIPVYSVSFNQHQIIKPSSLGFELGLPINGGFKLISKENGERNTVWKPLYGEYSQLRDRYNSLIIKLKETGKPYRLLNIEFKAYNEGFAFRYLIPVQPNTDSWIIKRELSEFKFIEGSTGFPIYEGEATFSKISVPVKEIKPGAHYPLTVNTGFGYASILEDYVVHYPRLRFGKTKNGDLCTAIMYETKISAPFSCPWRTVILGKDEGKLIENEYLGLNLNPASSLKDVSWIKPGKTITPEGTLPIRTDTLKKLVDFAAENGFGYVQLDWGWYGTEVKWDEEKLESFRKVMPERMKNADWGKNTKGNPFSVAKGWVPYGWTEQFKDFQIYVDLDLNELIRYGKTKDIGICLYIEAGSTLRACNLDSLFSLYEKWGVAGIKPGFVRYGSRENTDWIRNMVAVAAKHKLWVCIHDQHVPDGMERTYPNLLSVEGGGGSEGNHPVAHDLMLPFTRCLAGAFDYCPVIYNPTTTNAHMMGFLVAYYNPATVVRGGYLAWNGNGSCGKGGDEIEFLKRVPASWDDTKVLKARIGEYLVIARRAGKSWYIGGLTGDNEYNLEINLDFLEPQKKYKATLFIDDPANFTTGISPAKKLETVVESSGKFKLPMEKAGGCAIILDETK